MSETFTGYLARYGRPDGQYPIIDLDSTDLHRHTVIVSFAGGATKAIVQFMGLAAGTDNEHLCLDVHAFVDDHQARSSVFGLENGKRYEGFTHGAPGRSHGRPAVRGVTVLIGAQTGPEPGRRRRAIYVDETMLTEHGYIPSVVIEGEPGHLPLSGNGEHSQPWYWGHDLAKARTAAAAANADLGLSPDDVTAILTSSFAARDRQDESATEQDR